MLCKGGSESLAGDAVVLAEVEGGRPRSDTDILTSFQSKLGTKMSARMA